MAELPTPLAPPRRAPKSGRPRSAHIDDVILRTTLHHLAERGYDGLSVNAIAAETGVSKPTIYLRWPSKAELAAAAVSYMHVDQTLTLTGDVRRDLIGHLKRVQRVLDTVGIGLTGTVLASQSSNPALLAVFRERTVRPSRQRVRRILQEGIRQGAIRTGVDVNAAVHLLVGALYAA